MEKLICGDCGSDHLGIRNNGPHSEMYCKECLAFVKFIPKKKARRFEEWKEKDTKPKLPFKKNYHLARNCRMKSVKKQIDVYPEQYPTPKYLIFIRDMILRGWAVKIYKARVSKYVFVSRGEHLFKIRFSNHKPLVSREDEKDCDFYVGISNRQVSTTEQIMAKLKEYEV